MRNMSHFKLMKCAEEESDYEINHMGDELELEEHETTPRRSMKGQRPINRYGNVVPSNLIS